MSDEEKTTTNNKIYYLKKYFSLALDPIHIGTGGYRIGRVDNTIVREPSTGIPKIPGTTIEGCCRSYAYLKGVEDEILSSKNLLCSKGKPKSDTEEQPCGKCIICITFGFSQKDKSIQAMALFSDARILFFPVATMVGPVWVTCPMALREAEIKENTNDIPEPEDNKFIVPKVSDSENAEIKPPENKLNFGWILLEKNNNKTTDISKWKYKESENIKELTTACIPDSILKRVVIVPDDLFATIVNSNLEVRTSVAIDPERGSVEERALFTYEAIPRGTIFWFDVIYQNPKNFPSLNDIELKWTINGKEKKATINSSAKDEELFEILESCVRSGLELFKYLGVGGMGSRGFGRLEVLNLGG